MKLTEKLDLLMKKKGITKADLSREADIPYTTIASLYDKGYENVKLSTLKKLANYFDCSLDYITDDSVTEENKFLTEPKRTFCNKPRRINVLRGFRFLIIT